VHGLDVHELDISDWLLTDDLERHLASTRTRSSVSFSSWVAVPSVDASLTMTSWRQWREACTRSAAWRTVASSLQHGITTDRVPTRAGR
jgi:hypothetical protein